MSKDHEHMKTTNDPSVGVKANIHELAKTIREIRSLLRGVFEDFYNYMDTQGNSYILRGKWQFNAEVNLALARLVS
jgi:hypothetical protein